MKKYFLFFFVFIILNGCMTTSIVKINENFDSKIASEQLKTGECSIKGSAFIKQAGGGIVTCAGREITLIPVTKYAEERITNIYGSNIGGFVPNYSLNFNRIIFIPDDENYHKLCLNTLGDAQGNFEFNNIKEGEYYLTTGITWLVSQYTYSGGILCKRIVVSKNNNDKMILTN